MTILFDCSTIVKPTAFAAGLLPSRSTPSRRSMVTDADRAWWSAISNAAARDYTVIGESDDRLEFNAGCALASARMDAGFCPF